jgi:hypothetical protein
LDPVLGGNQNIDACFSLLKSNPPNIFESNVQLQEPILNFEKGTKKWKWKLTKGYIMLGVSHVHFGNAYFLLQVFILLFHVMRCIGLPMQIKFFYHIFPPILNDHIHSKG